MAAPPRPWTVLPHEPIARFEDNLWSVRGALPRGSMWREMTMVRLPDGRLVFHNAIPLDEASMRMVEAWGSPGFLVVANRFHRLDIHAFKQRYPKLRVLCPAGDHKQVEEKVAVDGHLDALPTQETLRLLPSRGTKNGEAILSVQSGPRRTLVFGDTLFNLPHLPGLDGALFRLIGSTGGVKVTFVARRLLINDKHALAAQFRELANEPGLHRLLFSHGAPVEGDEAVRALKAAADSLG